MTTIRFVAYGTPVGQGSKTAYRNKHTGKVNLVESAEGLALWRDTLIVKAHAAHRGHEAFTGPVEVCATFYFDRPKSHYGTGRNARLLKPSAPAYHIVKPDADKLQRALGDALKLARVIKDDAQIAVWSTGKYYTSIRSINGITLQHGSGAPGVEVSIEELI